MASFQFVGKAAACFRNDLDTALDQPLLLPIELEGIERCVSQDSVNAFDRLDDIRETGDGRTRGH